MDYAKVLRLPQYFRNLQRLSEIAKVLAKHGFGDLLQRINLTSYLGVERIWPKLITERPSTLSLPTRLRLVCEELGPTFIKLAQVVATRPDLFPPPIVAEFRKLQDEATPFPGEKARELVEAEFGRPLTEIFMQFDDIPLAAASIAQVHRASLPGGQAVAVKIQRPGIERVIETDIDILLGLAALLEENIPESVSFNPTELIEEFARGLRREYDFRREAQNIRQFADNFAGEGRLRIPHVYEQLCSRSILTEEFIEGLRADDAPGIRAAGLDTKQIAAQMNSIVLRSIFEHRYFHADPHPGNVLITKDGLIAFVDFGAMGRLDKGRVYQILQFLVAVFEKNPERILHILHENHIAPRSLDESSLKGQIAEILDMYVGKTLSGLNVSRLLADIFEVLQRYGMTFPPDLLLVGKSLTTLQFIGAILDPEFDPVESIRPYLVQQYVKQLTDPRFYTDYLSQVGDSYRRLLAELPIELRAILKNLAHDDLTINIVERNLAETQRHQNRLVNRGIIAATGLVLTVLGAAVAIFPQSGIHMSISYILIGWGSLLLLLIWRAVRKSGGTF